MSKMATVAVAAAGAAMLGLAGCSSSGPATTAASPAPTAALSRQTEAEQLLHGDGYAESPDASAPNVRVPADVTGFAESFTLGDGDVAAAIVFANPADLQNAAGALTGDMRASQAQDNGRAFVIWGIPSEVDNVLYYTK